MKTILLAALLTVVSSVQAASFSSENLPAALQTELQNCSSDQGCYITDTSLVDIEGMSAYLKYDLYAPDSLTWLIRYNLFSPSNSTHLSGSTGVTTVTPFSGSIWLRASNSFNPADQSHQFSIYGDTVSPMYFDVINLGLTAPDLLAGSGFIHVGWNGETVEGALQGNVWACIECPWGIDFNLIYLDYSSGSLDFNMNDKRTLLLSQYIGQYVETNDANSASFYVQSVPLPSALILFGSGLLGMLGLRKTSTKFQ